MLCEDVSGSMLPAGLVWGRTGATDGTILAAGAYGVAPPTAGAQQLVYCYSPSAGATAADVTGVQLPASLTYHHQLQQQQQQQILLAAKSLQQQTAQQMYVQTALGLQPYQLPAASSLSAASTGLQLHGPLALTPNLPYISSDQVYLPPAAGVTPTSIALTSARKVRRLPFCRIGVLLDST